MIRDRARFAIRGTGGIHEESSHPWRGGAGHGRPLPGSDGSGRRRLEAGTGAARGTDHSRRLRHGASLRSARGRRVLWAGLRGRRGSAAADPDLVRRDAGRAGRDLRTEDAAPAGALEPHGGERQSPARRYGRGRYDRAQIPACSRLRARTFRCYRGSTSSTSRPSSPASAPTCTIIPRRLPPGRRRSSRRCPWGWCTCSSWKRSRSATPGARRTRPRVAARPPPTQPPRKRDRCLHRMPGRCPARAPRTAGCSSNPIHTARSRSTARCSIPTESGPATWISWPSNRPEALCSCSAIRPTSAGASPRDRASSPTAIASRSSTNRRAAICSTARCSRCRCSRTASRSRAGARCMGSSSTPITTESPRRWKHARATRPTWSATPPRIGSGSAPVSTTSSRRRTTARSWRRRSPSAMPIPPTW